MTGWPMFHEGNRKLQDLFDSRRIADRLEAVRMHAEFSETDREIIEKAAFFFIATADAKGRPDCSYKGGEPGFVRVVGAGSLVFPDYDGNGMFKSLGNILANPAVGLLFLETDGERRRLRINGAATLLRPDTGRSDLPGGRLLIQVDAHHIFPNCPRYIHLMPVQQISEYAPRDGYRPPEPLWKSKPDLKDFLPRTFPPTDKPDTEK